jgi:hypothetical protein
MSDSNGTPGAAAADGSPSATFDQTGGLMDEFTGEDDDGRNQGAGPGEIGNPLRPGGQDGAVGDVAEGEEPHLDPDADADGDEWNP